MKYDSTSDKYNDIYLWLKYKIMPSSYSSTNQPKFKSWKARLKGLYRLSENSE